MEMTGSRERDPKEEGRESGVQRGRLDKDVDVKHSEVQCV